MTAPKRVAQGWTRVGDPVVKSALKELSDLLSMVTGATPTVVAAPLAPHTHPQYISRDGDTMNAPLVLSGAPTIDLHASTKKYVDDTVSASAYTLPTASASVLGGVKVGSGLAIDGAGVLSATYSYTLPTASATVLGGVKVGTTLSISSGVLDYTLPTASASVLGGVKVGTGLTITGGVLSNNNPTPYTLPTASATVLGGVKVGSGLAIDGAGVLSATYSYTLPTASATVLGGVKVGSGLAIDGAGVLSATYSYTLPTASATVLGGVKVGTSLSIASGILDVGDISATYLTVSAASTTYQPIFGSQTAKTFYAAPNGAAGTPSFRAIVASDIPTLNQNTTGTAAGLSGTPNISVGTISATGNALLDSAAATSVTTLVDSPSFTLRGSYWNGTAAVDYDATIVHDLLSTSGTISKLSFFVGGSERGYISSAALGTGENSLALAPTSWVRSYVATLGYTSSTGTVTSVGLSLPTIFTVTNSPVTSSGTLTASLANQAINTVFAGPSSGAAGTPAFRSLVAADIPTLAYLPTAGGSLTGNVTSNSNIVASVLGASFASSTGATRISVKVSADATYKWGVSDTGVMSFGDGTTVDTNLYRSAANTLKTDDDFQAASLSVGTTKVIDSTGNLINIGTISATGSLSAGGMTTSGFLVTTNTSSSVSAQSKAVPTLTNSWVNYDSTETTFAQARYFKDALGVVHLEGLVKNTAANANAIFTLPAGYRPKKARLFAGNGSSGYVDLRVDPTGAVGVANGVFGWASLDGVTFLAEQ